MYTPTAFFAAALAASTLAWAAPTGQPAKRQDVDFVTVTMIGAAGAEYSVDIPFDSTYTTIDNDLSISHIQAYGGPVACLGVDGSLNEFDGSGYQDVGPPQTIAGCVAGP